jgi:DnaJ like chaperone protein
LAKFSADIDMSIWGKILGGATGFAFGGPIGAIVGTVAGHAVDKYRAAQDQETDGDPTKSVAFTIGVIILSAKMAKADGVVTREEVNAFKQMFKVPEHEAANVSRVFNQARKDSAGFEPYACQLADMFVGNPAVLEELLSCLAQIAHADGKIHPDELIFLEAVSDIFGLDQAVFERVTAIERSGADADIYQVLGVNREISNDDLKSAYRALVRENHPDRLIAQGLPEEFIDLANKRLAAINSAYDAVQLERGLA